MRISSNNTTFRGPKLWITIAASVVALLGAYFAFGYYTKSLWPFANNNSQASSNTDYEGVRNINDIDYGNPSQEDIDNSQNGKKNATSEDTNTTPDSNGKTRVSVGVTYAGVTDGKFEVRAFTPGVIEGGGTCTATFTKGSLTFTESSSAFIDSSTSQCDPMYISLGKFAENGTWNMVLTYSSDSATGSSEKIEVTL